MPTSSYAEQHTKFLVIGIHRPTGAAHVWTGVTGFQPVSPQYPVQLVGGRVADELRREIAQSSSARKFEIQVIPVRDVTSAGRDSRIILQ